MQDKHEPELTTQSANPPLDNQTVADQPLPEKQAATKDEASGQQRPAQVPASSDREPHGDRVIGLPEPPEIVITEQDLEPPFIQVTREELGLGGPSMEQVLRSEKPRVTKPDVAPGELEELVAGNTQFAFDLYHALWDKGLNLLYSPFSISAALAMVYAGARGKTERQMAQTLHFTLGQDSLHKACNALNLSLIGGGEDKGISGLFPDTYVANALWGQAGDRFLQQFLDLLAENYGSELQILDFAGDPEGSCHKINDWASQKTQGRIQDLLPEGSLGQLTRLVLTNAIYFYATWGRKFEQSRTRESTFHLTAGGRVTVPLMEQTEQFGYAEGDGYQAVELPYAGRSSSMVIILPPIQGFESFSTGLDAERLAAILRETQPANVHLALPRFRCISEVMLGDRLEKLGMADAFSPAADFSGITGRPELCISQVFHKAFVAVDEAGTEAAAATAVVFDGVTCPQPEPPVEFIVDHPFVFLIRDTMTGSILFLGHVVDPTA